MAVVLSGVAADTTNASPVPEVTVDGEFDYVPIPERASDATVEETTYGDWRLRTGSTAADALDEIRPRGDASHVVTGDRLADWPLHHDPNFTAATYGERRPAYVTRLNRLEPGDAVVFYTGLRGGDGGLHRYLVGYIEIDAVHDVDAMEHERAVGVLEDNPENAHAKRYRATGEVDDGLVVVDGRDAEVFDRATRISSRRDNGHYYLRDRLRRRWPADPSDDVYLGGVKQAHHLKIDVEDVLEAVETETA